MSEKEGHNPNPLHKIKPTRFPAVVSKKNIGQKSWNNNKMKEIANLNNQLQLGEI